METALKQSYGQAGIKTCLLTFFHKDVEVFYATPDLSTVSTLGLSFQEGLSALADPLAGSVFSQTQTNNNLHLQAISLNQGMLTPGVRALLQELSLNRVHALVQDMQGQWWLFGQERGLKLRFKSDTDAGLSITLTGLEKQPASLVAANLIPGFLTFLN